MQILQNKVLCRAQRLMLLLLAGHGKAGGGNETQFALSDLFQDADPARIVPHGLLYGAAELTLVAVQCILISNGKTAFRLVQQAGIQLAAHHDHLPHAVVRQTVGHQTNRVGIHELAARGQQHHDVAGA